MDVGEPLAITVTEAARLLGISYATMKNKVARYRLDEPHGRGRR